MSNHSPRVPKFGDWDLNGENKGQQSFTLIFDNMRGDKSMKNMNPNDPAFLAEYFNSPSSSSAPQAVVQDAGSAPPLPSVSQNQSPRVPKFGDWDTDGESSQPSFTLIFDNMRADKNMKNMNPNDPAFLTEYFNSSSSSPFSQAIVHDSDSAPPVPPVHESPSHPFNLTSKSSMSQKDESPHVPKFGDWDMDGKNEEEEEFSLIFDSIHADKSMKRVSPNNAAFLADSLNSSLSSSSSLQAARHGVNQQPSSPLRHESPRSPLKPSSRGSINQKSVMAPKFGNWDVEHPMEYTPIFDELKEEKRIQPASPHHGFKTSTSLPHKTSCMSWRLCFRSRNSQVVID